MPRSPSTYSLPPGTTPQQPNTVISSSMFNAFADDVAQTFNTVQPVAYGGTGTNDLKLSDADFGIKDSVDPTKIVQFDVGTIPTATTRTWTAPYYSGTLGLVSDIRGQIYGLTLSNNVTDATNDIDIAAGTATDSSGTRSMLLATGITKRLDAVWAVGTNQGMLATGAALTNAWYHIFEICRPDTGVVDIAADTSILGANIPANTNVAYTLRRYIGSILRTAGAIKPFYQLGDVFLWKNAPPDINAASMGTAAVARALTVPQDTNVIAILRAGVNVASGGDGRGLIYSPYQNDPTLASEFFNVGSSVITSGSQLQTWNQIQVLTNTNREIMTKFIASAASTNLIVTTDGYINTRGKNG